MDGKLGKCGQGCQLGRNAPSQFIPFQFQMGQSKEIGNFRGDASGKLVVLETNVGNIIGKANEGGNLARELVVVQVKTFQVSQDSNFIRNLAS